MLRIARIAMITPVGGPKKEYCPRCMSDYCDEPDGVRHNEILYVRFDEKMERIIQQAAALDAPPRAGEQYTIVERGEQ